MKRAKKAKTASFVSLLLPLFVLMHGTDALAQSCVQPPLGTIAWWPMDETSGTTVKDLAGNHPGIVVNGPRPGATTVDEKGLEME